MARTLRRLRHRIRKEPTMNNNNRRRVLQLAGIAVFGSVPNILVVSSKSGMKTLADLIERSKKGNLTFASAGTGSASHWGAERLRIACGIEATHVPFRGGPEGLTEVMTGRVDFMSIGGASGLTLIRDGSLTPLVVSTRVRSVALPDVPTVIEAGFPARSIRSGTDCWRPRRRRARSWSDCTSR
jgi:tripartite-type tricarboxylate transporter receptor subunit TctC